MPTEVREGVYDVTTHEPPSGRRYRVFLVDDPVPTLVDTGHDHSADALIEALEGLGIAPERLLITHCDGDHVGAFDALVDRYGVETHVAAGADVGADHEPDVRLGDGDAVGGFTVVATPGHTPDHVSYVHEDRGVAVFGDAAFGSDLRGLPAGYYVLPPAVYSEDLNRADESLERLLEFDFDVGLLYHGSSVLEAARERLERFVRFPGR